MPTHEVLFSQKKEFNKKNLDMILLIILKLALESNLLLDQSNVTEVKVPTILRDQLKLIDLKIELGAVSRLKNILNPLTPTSKAMGSII